MSRPLLNVFTGTDGLSGVPPPHRDSNRNRLRLCAQQMLSLDR
ncbi:hypothetical protein CLOSTMETH_01510 [[Clostridium] methylpentosum DSM 5476]|uniref:Uncharacterized protein n=1 Tax=[Clostridium] methylpentosum DSM 5476 TaxID=537013 RepID=C0ECE0_9FIRM|nr:hypothetical protein CLOSTMETH_01510 [[Clostridium] methylpentosum DSM 5476]